MEKHLCITLYLKDGFEWNSRLMKENDKKMSTYVIYVL